MKIEQTVNLIQIASPCYRAFPTIWNVASARDEISLRKWSGGTAHLCTSEGALVAKNAFYWQQCFFYTHVFLYIV